MRLAKLQHANSAPDGSTLQGAREESLREPHLAGRYTFLFTTTPYTEYHRVFKVWFQLVMIAPPSTGTRRRGRKKKWVKLRLRAETGDRIVGKKGTGIHHLALEP